MPKLSLTDQQKDIINHTDGPALVFAVAGSGKTTSMVHRIKRMVEHGDVLPQQILATSFSNNTVNDIRDSLGEVGIKNVDLMTLHVLGKSIIKSAVKNNHILDMPELEKSGTIAYYAIIELSKKYELDAYGMEINAEDLVAYIDDCKGNIIYADLERKLSSSDFPDSVTPSMKQAEHSNNFYVEAYQKYEEIRQEKNWYTFGDMLLTAWECLVQFDQIATIFQNKYHYALVDEFQDVNKVQYEILDIIQQKHRNYMVIGDDDQCIYEWRGAKPDFIMNFKKHYGAKEYLIEENFRSTGHQTLLANSVIHKNSKRKSKVVNLTQGFNGSTQVSPFDSSTDEAISIVNDIQAIGQGDDYNNMVILVRMWGDSISLQAELLNKKVKFDIDGNKLFYKRKEIHTLIQYMRFIAIEQDYSEEESGIAHIELYRKSFEGIVNSPKRYVANKVIKAISAECKVQKRLITDLLPNHFDSMGNSTREKVEDFIDLIGYLKTLHDKSVPAKEILEHLVEWIGYDEYLKRSSGLEIYAIEKIKSYKAFIRYLMERGPISDVLNHLVSLNQDYENLQKEPENNWLRITTVYRAKGLEWEHVFIPSCNDGSFPSSRSSEESIEAERRVFYVAITRAKKHLYISYVKNSKISPFLSEVDYESILLDANNMEVALLKDADNYSDEDTINLALCTKKHPLIRYLEKWWKVEDDEKLKIVSNIEKIEEKSQIARKNNPGLNRDLEQQAKELKRVSDQADTPIIDIARLKFRALGNTKKHVGMPVKIVIIKDRTFLSKQGLPNEKSFPIAELIQTRSVLQKKPDLVSTNDYLISTVGDNGLIITIKPRSKKTTQGPKNDKKRLVLDRNKDLLVERVQKNMLPKGTILSIVPEEKSLQFMHDDIIYGQIKSPTVSILTDMDKLVTVLITGYSNSEKNFYITPNTDPALHVESIKSKILKQDSVVSDTLAKLVSNELKSGIKLLKGLLKSW